MHNKNDLQRETQFFSWQSLLCFLLILLAIAVVGARAGDGRSHRDRDDDCDKHRETIPFAIAEVFFEFNSTDNDLGLQVLLDAEDWKHVTISDPNNKKIVQFQANGPLRQLGITELRFESAEPSPEEVLALFEPGKYTFRGKTVEGDRLIGSSVLSHDLSIPPVFSPAEGDVVDPENAVVEWDTPGAEFVEVIIVDEEFGTVFDVIVPGDTTSLNIPSQFLHPDTEYKIEILSIGANGNKTITESFFFTLP